MELNDLLRNAEMMKLNPTADAYAGIGSKIAEMMKLNPTADAYAGIGSKMAEMMKLNLTADAYAGIGSAALGLSTIIRQTNAALGAGAGITSGIEARLREFDAGIAYARQLGSIHAGTSALRDTFAGISTVLDVTHGSVSETVASGGVIADAKSVLSGVAGALNVAFPQDTPVDHVAFERGVERILARISEIEESSLRQFVFSLFFSLLLAVAPLMFPHLLDERDHPAEDRASTPVLPPNTPDVVVEHHAIVQASVLNVRELDSTKAAVVAKLRRGERVTILTKHEHWLNVRWNDPVSGSTICGWVARKHVALLDQSP